jgi:uncharacterized protein
MAVQEERGAARGADWWLPADPAPLGLAAFALTTFMLSGHNADFIPDVVWIPLAFFYGGLVQLLAGMWEYRNRNVFGATAFSTYGGFWLSLGVFVAIFSSQLAAHVSDLSSALGWFLFSFAIFNTYMLLWSLRVSGAVFAVFLTLEITEILLAIGFWLAAHRGVAPTGAEVGWIKAGGWAGVITAATAWYASAAGVINNMSPRPILPVWPSPWGRIGVLSRMDSPSSQRTGA